MPQRDVNGLPPDEAYAVTVMRRDDGPIRSGIIVAPNLLCVGHTPVCTWETLFRMLGRGVVEVRPPAPGAPVSYGLAEAWWSEEEPVKDAA